MFLWEIFDSELDVEWKKVNRHELTKFVYDNKTFIIQIETKKFSEFPEIKSAAEVSFFRQDKSGDSAFASTHDTSVTPVKVYGIVANALIKKFSEYNAFYFSAEKRHSTEKDFAIKNNVYEMLSDRLAKKTGAKLYTYTDGQSVNYLVCREKIESNKFKNPTKEALAQIGIDWSE